MRLYPLQLDYRFPEFSDKLGVRSKKWAKAKVGKAMTKNKEKQQGHDKTETNYLRLLLPSALFQLHTSNRPTSPLVKPFAGRYKASLINPTTPKSALARPKEGSIGNEPVSQGAWSANECCQTPEASVPWSV